jgi:CHRD domain
MIAALTAGPWRMRAACWIVATAAFTACGCASLASAPNVRLSGREEVPAVTTEGSGVGRITVGRGKKISGSIQVSGVEVMVAHIHIGGPGRIGPPIVTLNKSSSTVWSVPLNTTLTDGQYQSYLAGELYVNVHSERYRSGEIRGQVQPPGG